MRVALAVFLGFILVGCTGGEVSEQDMASVRDDFSKEKYEKAMIAAGKGEELAKQKAAMAERGDQ